MDPEEEQFLLPLPFNLHTELLPSGKELCKAFSS